MFDGIKVILISTLVTALVGGILGLLVGVLIGEPLIAVGVGAFLGANFGVVLSYGFLPEAPADQSLETEGDS
ncbi:MAG: hypothetical protein O6949_05995 [Chloroflexi bacterium]|nr:hypothetical protein [Chloroflexota bacterium]